MVKIIGNDIVRGGQKVGWIAGNDIRDHDGRKVGYFEGDFVYGVDGHKKAYISDNYLRSENGLMKISLDKINEEIEGGMLSEIGRCAVYMLIGD